MTIRRIAIVTLLLAGSGQAEAGQLTMHIGPPSVGQGGSNPVSVPPTNITEYEFEYVTKNGFESNIGIVPGLLFGGRSTMANGAYASFGGGIVLSSNGTGPGAYSSIGMNFGKTWMFNAEVKQAIGYSFSNDKVVSPYAVRIGVAVEL